MPRRPITENQRRRPCRALVARAVDDRDSSRAVLIGNVLPWNTLVVGPARTPAPTETSLDAYSVQEDSQRVGHHRSVRLLAVNPLGDDAVCCGSKHEGE
jgi:hypothetical protein